MDIRQILNRMKRVKLQYIYEEVNAVANATTDIGFGLKEIFFWRCSKNLMTEIKALICRERMATVSI